MGSEVAELLYLNSMASDVLDDLARERARHEQETRVLRALAAPTTRPALMTRQKAAVTPAPERRSRWRVLFPWRVNLAEAA